MGLPPVAGDVGSAAWLVCGVGRRKRLWGFTNEERRVLLEATRSIPELEMVVLRAVPALGLEGTWLVEASVRELDDMYSLVGALMDATRNRRRLDLLEGLLATLCTSIDGF